MTDFLRGLAGRGELEVQVNGGGFVARNFLLDEGVAAVRLESYRAAGAAARHATLEEWTVRHRAYLKEQVAGIHPGEGRPQRIGRDDPLLCPETFRSPAASPYRQSAPLLDLARLVDVGSLQRRTGLAAAEVERCARAALEGGSDAALSDLLAGWQATLDLRPVYAVYWEDIADLFGATAAEDAPDWADRVRDCLGLAHLDPAARGGPLPVLLFRYPVKALPLLQGLGPEERPLVPPTVLDGTFSAAFCPAPAGSATGHVIHLDGGCPPLRREVLHPAFDLTAGHLLRVGTIRKGVAVADLPAARGLHLACLRAHGAAAGYGAATDGDLL